MDNFQALSINLLEEQSDLIFFSLDLDYKYISFSKKHSLIMELIWGKKIELGVSIFEYISNDEDRKKAKNNFDKAIECKLPFIVEEQFGDKFTHRCQYKDSYFPMEENGEAIGIFVIVEEMKHIEDKQIFEQIVRLTKSGITLADCTKADKPLVFVNDAFVSITGYEKDEVYGRNCRFLQNDDRNQEAVYKAREAIKNKEYCEVELRNYKKDGTLFYNLLSLSPIFDSNGDMIYYIGIQNDITKLKQQNELYYQKKRAESLTNLIKNISHQWRQPLSLISTLSGSIQLKNEVGLLSDDDLIEHTTRIILTTQYLSNILTDFDGFLINDNRENFKLISIINNEIKMFKDINFIIGFDDNLEISSYKNILQRCISGLISNCENALTKEDNKLIVIDCIKAESETIITISDNGSGIDDSIVENIFDPYFTTKHQTQGTGLGLYLIQVFLQNIGGSISVKNGKFIYDNKEYSGAIATITLFNGI